MIVEGNDLPSTLAQAGKHATQNLTLLASVVEVKGIRVVIR
jgi:hypothetical protein